MAEAESIGVNSTPTFFVNGKRLAGAVPLDQFKSIIDPELAKGS
jgi:protein-disulfide isomerase